MTLLRKIGLMSILILVTVVSVFLGGRPDYTNYMAAFIDKQNRLETTMPPRIVLIGGSNVAFGLDSEMISESTNLPVVNLGLHAGLGLKFMVNSYKPYLRAGDIIIIIPEYELFYGPYLNPDPGCLGALLGVYPQARRYLDLSTMSLDDTVSMFVGIAQYKKNVIQSSILKRISRRVENTDQSLFVYSRDNFNEFGDEVKHLTAKPGTQPDTTSPIIESLEISPKVISFLNQFADYAHSRKANVYLDYPSRLEYNTSEEQSVGQLQQVLEEDLTFPIIGIAADHLFPLEYFFDTNYHLNSGGRRINTERLIDDILQRLSIGKQQA